MLRRKALENHVHQILLQYDMLPDQAEAAANEIIDDIMRMVFDGGKPNEG